MFLHCFIISIYLLRCFLPLVKVSCADLIVQYFQQHQIPIIQRSDAENGCNIIAFLEEHPFSTIYFAPVPRIEKIAKEKLDRQFSLGCILHLNQEEACSFTKQKDVKQAAKHLSSLTNNDVIVTLRSR